jgi:hypothetical protein
MNSNTNKYNPQALIPYQQQKIQQLQQKKQALQQKITADAAYDYVQLQTEQPLQQVARPISPLLQQAQQMDLDIAMAQDLLFNLEQQAMNWASGAGVNEKRTVTRTENSLTTESTLKSPGDNAEASTYLVIGAAVVAIFAIALDAISKAISANPEAFGLMVVVVMALVIWLKKGGK